MADQEQVARLKKGVTDWNAWRDENPNIRPDLKEAKLEGANLCRANLTRADLSEARLYAADLTHADLAGADLTQASLVRANLSKANLPRAKFRLADLGGADFTGANLAGADLYRTLSTGAKLTQANLIGADLTKANLIGADLDGAYLGGASLAGADLGGADLTGANLAEANLGCASLTGVGEPDLEGANLYMAKLTQADLGGAYLAGAYLAKANLAQANLIGANLIGANLRLANLSGANLTGANLRIVTLVNTNLTDADLTGCHVFGVSAWNLKLDRAKQQNLVITDDKEPKITVDNVEVAQFINLIRHNEKIRDVIDTITAKAVLILGRFTDKRKVVLDALREELRKRDYLPILFDFDVPASRDITETVSLLAHMARFIIADLTDPSSIPKELEAIVPSLAVPVQPLLDASSRPYAMFKDNWKYDWVLPVYRYEGLEQLLEKLAENVIAPSEEKVKALEDRRRLIEAELTKPH